MSGILYLETYGIRFYSVRSPLSKMIFCEGAAFSSIGCSALKSVRADLITNNLGSVAQG